MDSTDYLPMDEQLRSESFQLKQFERLGFSLTEAIDAINRGVDWHYVQNLINNGCSRTLALDIAA